MTHGIDYLTKALSSTIQGRDSKMVEQKETVNVEANNKGTCEITFQFLY